MTAPLTREQLAALEALEKAATKAPWQIHHEHDCTGYPSFFIHGLSGSQKSDTKTLEADESLIEALRNAAPALIAAAKERDELRERLTAMQRDRAALSDKLNGTPCAEIRWQQEMDELRAELAAAREVAEYGVKMLALTHDITKQQAKIIQSYAHIEAAADLRARRNELRSLLELVKWADWDRPAVEQAITARLAGLDPQPKETT